MRQLTRTALVLIAVSLARGAAAGPADIKVDTLKGAPPPGVKASGPSLDGAYDFDDKNGRNYVLFSSKAIRTHTEGYGDVPGGWIWVDHWIVPAGGKPKLVRTVKELVDECSDSLTLVFHDGAFGVTDLDGDGYAEITFAYEVGCRSDVSSNTYKLILLENGDKFILRGTTRIDTMGMEGVPVGGTFTPDPDAKKWPKGFLDHAKALWDRTADDSQVPPKGGPTPGTEDDPGPPPPKGGHGGNPCGG